MKQTAVEWQHIELSKFLYGKSEFTDANDILIKAKEMENEQMIDWYATGQADTVNMYEQHLNKTFNTNQENLQDSTNGYTYYPRENKTVFNTKEK
jgi:dTDP-glucose pyrophosphorylase